MSDGVLPVLNILLRQHAAEQGCLVVNQSFLQNDPKNFAHSGGRILGCNGFHSSFGATQRRSSLNFVGSRNGNDLNVCFRSDRISTGLAPVVLHLILHIGLYVLLNSSLTRAYYVKTKHVRSLG